MAGFVTLDASEDVPPHAAAGDILVADPGAGVPAVAAGGPAGAPAAAPAAAALSVGAPLIGALTPGPAPSVTAALISAPSQQYRNVAPPRR